MHKEKPVIQIPSFSLRVIRFWCREELYEEIEGNLYEYYSELNNPKSLRSILSYWNQVQSYLRPGTLKKINNTHLTMFNFNPKLTIRNLWNHKVATAINIGGFAISLFCVFYLYSYITNEIFTDRFHQNKEEIYRTIRVSEIRDEKYLIGVTSGPFADGLMIDYPGQISATSRVWLDEGLIQWNDKSFYEQRLAFVDQNFFQFFSFPLASGDPSIVYSVPNSVVISQAVAKKYFGNTDPIGEILKLDNEYDFIVTGIMGEAPGKSHLEFDMAFPISVFDEFDWFHNWWNNSLMTYVRIEDPEVANQIESTLPQFMDKYFGEDFQTNGKRVDLTLEPLEDVYFNNTTRYDPARHGNLNTITILIIVGIAIIFISSFNYINLSIAQSLKRSKEVSVRKVLGGGSGRLILQFIGEVTVQIFIASFIAILLSFVFVPLLNRFLGLYVEIDWSDPFLIIFLIGLIVALIILSGIYPSLKLAGLNPLYNLRHGNKTRSNSFIRRILVTGQFAISISLIAATLLVSSQLNYMNNKELGFTHESVLIVELNNQELRENMEAFKVELTQSSVIESVTQISGEPGGFHDVSSFKFEGIEENIRLRTLFTDDQYIETFQLNIIGGKNFKPLENRDLEFDQIEIIVNQTALRDMNLNIDEAIGNLFEMPMWEIKGTLVGVVEDYHFQSLHNKIEPLAIIRAGRPRRIAVKANSENIEQVLTDLNHTWEKYSPSFPISYSFLDDSLFQLYQTEKKQSQAFTVFAGISIFLACLGVLGLASYSASQRQKEFGIRKVLGAPVSHIIGLISKDFMLLISISTLVAIPVVIYFLNQWLSGFAYKIDLLNQWPMMLASGIITAGIAWMAIFMITYRAAILKPTESIRNE